MVMRKFQNFSLDNFKSELAVDDVDQASTPLSRTAMISGLESFVLGGEGNSGDSFREFR